MADGSSGVTTQGSRTYFFGTSSGLNTAALVEAAYNQRVSEADKIDIKISKNTKKAEAYTTLQALSKSVQTTLANLRTSYGAITNTNYAFNARAGTLTTNNTTDPTKLLGVSIDPGTLLGSYQLEVIKKAAAHRIGSDPAASATTALGATGSFNIGLAGGASAAINVTNTMSMTDIASAINLSTATSGVSASILKISDTSYQLVLSGNKTAKDIAISGITGTNVLQNIGVLAAGVPKNVLQLSSQAQVKLDGVLIVRDNNDITDLIPGVNLSIKNAEPGTLIDLDIKNDSSTVKSAIMAFTEAYNAYREFVITNQTVVGGVVPDDAVLFGDTILKTMNDSVQPLLGSSYGSGGANLATLRELGITLDPTNRFVVDETILDTAILNKFDQVKDIFSTKTTSNNSNFALLANTSKQKNMSFTMNILTNGSGTITGVSIGGDNTLFDISGSGIKGKAGTIYEGLSFAYVGLTNANVNFTMTQGIGDLISNTLDQFTAAGTGTLANEKLNLGDQNEDMATRADRVRERADDFRQKLIDRYARYEASIARSKSIISQLKAILGVKDDA